MTDKVRQKGVRIPLTFSQAVEGLLAVDPKSIPAKKVAKPKAATAKKAKKR